MDCVLRYAHGVLVVAFSLVVCALLLVRLYLKEVVPNMKNVRLFLPVLDA